MIANVKSLAWVGGAWPKRRSTVERVERLTSLTVNYVNHRGEDLFGLPHQTYTQLDQTEKAHSVMELKMEQFVT